MKTKTLLLFLSLSFVSGNAVTRVITEATGQLAFSPATITINLGDDVNFVLSSFHDAVEVSQQTYQSNGTASNGGFNVPFGGGMIQASQLTLGTHYYVCTSHVLSGMKGTITVVNPTAVDETHVLEGFTISPNPAVNYFKIEISDNDLRNTNFTLYNMIGSQMLVGRLTGKSTLVDVNSLNEGLYIVRFEGYNNAAFKIKIRK